MLTGLVCCGYCGSACSGGADTNAGAWGERSEPWRFYVCGNQKRKGWATCELGKVSVDKVERAIIHHALDQVLTRDYLSGLLEEVRRSFGVEESERQLAEGRQYLQELDKVIAGLVNAIEQRPSSSLMARLAERERERDETLARVAQIEARRRKYSNVQLNPRDLDVLVDELRRGLKADHATVRDTLRRVVSKVEVRKDGGTAYIPVPPRAILSVGSPGAFRLPEIEQRLRQ